MLRVSPSHLAFASTGLLLGLSLGGLGAESRLRGALADAGSHPRHGRATGTEIARIFEGHPLPAEDAHDDPTPPAPEPPDEGATPPPAPVEVPAENLQQVRDAMGLRNRLARQALEDQADPSEEQLASIDAVFSDMNADLGAIAADFVARYGDGTEPDRRDMMAFAADTLDVLIGTEDRLDAVLTPEQRANLSEEALDPLSYVDQTVVDELAELNR